MKLLILYIGKDEGRRMLVDMHCHILPGMDDGSPDIDTSIQMLHHQREQGVEVICGTSHYYAFENSITAFCERRAVAMRKLTEVMPEGLPYIIPAAETAYFSGIGEHPGMERLCIQGSKTLMLEMPFTEWTDFQVEEVTALVLDRGFRVVLVHPERFCTSKGNRKKLRQLEELPVALQVNAGTLLQWRRRRLGLELLQEASIPLLGSDCHNLTSRMPNLQEGRKIVEQKLGAGFLDQMDRNAEQLIQTTIEQNP